MGRASNQFDDGEIEVLDFILQRLLEGHTPAMATRHHSFASLYRKVVTMKKRIESLKKQKEKSGGKEEGEDGQGVRPESCRDDDQGVPEPRDP